MATVLRAVPDPAQLSFNEELIWRNEHGDACVPFIECPRHLSIVARLRGRLNLRVLSDAIDGVVARHTALRSLYQRDGDSDVRRVVRREQRKVLRVFDESEGAGSLDDVAGLEAIKRDVDRPFDLSQDIPIRASCLPMADGSHVLAVTVHHIAFDGWSRGVLIRDLNPLRADRDAPLDVSRSDYRSYVLWQRGAVERGVWENQRCYWLKQFEGRMRRASASAGADAQTRTDPHVKWFSIGGETAARMRAYARGQHVTVAMLMLGVFAMLVHCVTDSDDIFVGVPIADRSVSKFEDTIGLLMNAFTIRIDLSGNPTLAEIAVAAHRAFTEAYEHRHIPYEYLIRTLGCREGAAPFPFRVVFNYLNVPQSVMALNGVDCERIAVPPVPPAAADVSLHVHDTRSELKCTMIASTTVWTTRLAAIEEMFESAINSFLIAPGDRVSQFTLSERSTAS